MQVNYCLNVVAVIHQSNVISESNIAMLGWRWWQLACQIPRGSVHFVPQTSIEHSSFPEARFLVGREPILRSKSGRRIILMFVVPVMRYLLIVFVELWTIPSICTVLSDDNSSAKKKRKRGKYNLER